MYCTCKTDKRIWVFLVWKNSLNENVCYIQKQVGRLKDLEKMCENINGIISNLSSNSKALDGKQFKEINCSLISELPFLSVIQVKLITFVTISI